MTDAVVPHYEIRGGTDDSEMLILVAGTGYPGRTWPREFLELLSPDLRVVTFDHRGTGSTPPTPGPYSTAQFADDVAALIAELGQPCHVLGHSMGGRVAQWLAIRHPESVTSLLLAASGMGGDPTGTQPRGLPMATCLGLLSRGYEGYVRDLQRRTFFTEGFVEDRSDVVGALGEAFWSGAPAIEDYLKHVIARQAHDASEHIATIQTPTRVFVGELDTHAGGTGSHYDQSVALAELLPDSAFDVIPACRHGMFWEQPRRTAELVNDWIRARA